MWACGCVGAGYLNWGRLDYYPPDCATASKGGEKIGREGRGKNEKKTFFCQVDGFAVDFLLFHARSVFRECSEGTTISPANANEGLLSDRIDPLASSYSPQRLYASKVLRSR